IHPPGSCERRGASDASRTVECATACGTALACAIDTATSGPATSHNTPRISSTARSSIAPPTTSPNPITTCSSACIRKLLTTRAASAESRKLGTTVTEKNNPGRDQFGKDHKTHATNAATASISEPKI